MQRILVDDHIQQLEREAASLRVERSLRAGRDPARVRVRLGHWLISLGAAVAGAAAVAERRSDASDAAPHAI